MKKTLTTNKYWIILVAGVALFVLGWTVFGIYSRSQDKVRFEEAETVKRQVVTELAKSLGDNVVNTSEKNECFNTEQGPFDNGKLWCQTATNIILAGDVDYSETGELFSKIAHNSGYSVNSVEGNFPEFLLNTPSGMKCHLQFQNSSGKSFGGARRLAFDDNSSALAISCSDRAKARHYPYVE